MVLESGGFIEGNRCFNNEITLKKWDNRIIV